MGDFKNTFNPLADLGFDLVDKELQFINRDGSINTKAFGGTGFARAVNTYPNSIGFNKLHL
jgi:hypothetical protein